MKSEILTYKGRPLVRCKDEFYYGDILKSHVIFIKIDSRMNDASNLPNKLSIGLINSSSAFHGNIFNPAKFSQKSSLFEALDLGSAWLDRVESK